MTLNGTIRGNVIELDQSTGLADGQVVRVELLKIHPSPWEPAATEPRRSVAEVQQRLKGKAQWFCDPTEPMIPVDDWDVLR